MIAWIGYDAPDWLGPAMTGGYANEGAPQLDRFVDGTRVARDAEGVDGRRVVIGHSYGSAVVGVAASTGNGLDVNDIIVAGSPGMRVPDATHLNIDPRHVWAGAATDDRVTQAGPIAHGTAPHTAEFGANRFHVDTSGHNDYWRPGSESLRNQAHILVGQYDRVTLDHGRPPAR
jgi:hypothetical protein